MLRNIPKFAVEHPMVMVPIFLALIGGGIILYYALPQEALPYIEQPSVGIIITFPGVSAEDMEAYFTRPIEQKMTVIDDLTFIRSTTQEGRMEVVIGFEYGVNLEQKKLAVQTLLGNMMNELPLDPENATFPWVVHIDSLNGPILDLAITHSTWDEVRLREFVENTMREQFEIRVPGIQSAIPYGGKQRQVIIEVDRDKLAAYPFGLHDIKTAVDNYAISRSGGRLVSREHDLLIRLDDRVLHPVKDLSNIPLGNVGDRIVYLKDVAEIKDSYLEVRSAYHFNGKPAILLAIVKQPEMGDPGVIKPALELAREFEQNYPGLQIETAFDRDDFILKLVENAWRQLFLAFLLTAIVLILFLQTITPSVIVLVTLPASFMAGFLLFKPFGQTINVATLMGMVFVLGRLVDDSVVMMDVIERHLKLGKTPKQAAIDGAGEVFFATLATSITFWIVLSPNLFLAGSFGKGFRGMTSPMIFANIFSTFFTLTLNPLMAAYLYKPYRQMLRDPLDRALRWTFSPVTWVLDKLERFYGGMIRWSLHYRFVVLALAIASIYTAWKMWPMLGFEGMPLQDTGQAVGEVEAWPGTSFEETEKIVSAVEKILLRQPEVLRVSTQIGQEPGFGTFFSGFGVRTVNKASFKITLTEKDARVCQPYERWIDHPGLRWLSALEPYMLLVPTFKPCSEKTGRDIWTILDSVQQEAIQTIPNIRSLWLMEMGATPVNTARAPVEALIKGNDLKVVNAIGQKALEVAQRTPGVVQPFTNWELALPEYIIKVDRARAAEVGITPQQIRMQAFTAMQGGMTKEFFKPEEGYRHRRLLIRYKPEQRARPEDLENLILTVPGKGIRVPLKAVATVERRIGTDTIYKEDLQYAVSVLAQYRNVGLKSATAGVIMGTRMSADLPKGYTVGPKGMMLDMLDNLYRLNRATYIAFFFLFVLLMLQTRSMVDTLTIMGSAPLLLLGSITFLYARNMNWSPPVQWGQPIALAIVVSVGIYLVDKTNQLRAEGMPRNEALINAGVIRLRPVLMTTLTTLMGFIPPMLAPPTGSDRFMPIATGMIGGITGSAALSLVLIPVLYSLLDDVRDFLRQIYRKPEWWDRQLMPEEEEVPAATEEEKWEAVGVSAGESNNNRPVEERVSPTSEHNRWDEGGC